MAETLKGRFLSWIAGKVRDGVLGQRQSKYAGAEIKIFEYDDEWLDFVYLNQIILLIFYIGLVIIVFKLKDDS